MQKLGTVRWSCGVLVALALLVGVSDAARADEPTAAQRSEHLRVSLLSDVEALIPEATFRVGVGMRIDPEWHVYWKEPGDAGLAPTFEWLLPPGFEVEEESWPVPAWHKADSIWTLIHEPELLVVFRIRAPSDVPPVATLSVRVDWLVCHDAKGCKPGHAVLALPMPRSADAVARRSADAAALDQHRERAPRPMPPEWRFSADRRLLHLGGEGPWSDPAAAFDFHPEDFGAFDRDAEFLPQRSEQDVTVRVPFVRTGDRPPESFHGVLTIRVGEETVGYNVGWGDRTAAWSPAELAYAEVVVASPQGSIGAEDDLAWAHAYVEFDRSAGGDASDSTWAWALLLALVGGLVLNLMPCVLPVLSLKVLGLVDHAQGPAVRVRRHGYAFAAGVIASFLAVAGLLLGVRAAGTEIGWGFQMQEPAVVVALAFLMLLLAMNLFGVFEIGVGFTRLGRTQENRGYAGSFATGVLTTVVATPCTAPFMGTAIGYAMTQSSVVALSVFGALGVGMSAPYVLLAAFPKLLKWVPAPGAWMETLRQVLAFPILATVVWLAWVFGRQMGGDSVPILCAGLLVAALAAWLYGRYGGVQRSAGVRWLVGRGIAVALLAAGLGLVFGVEPAPSVGPVSAGGWQPYSGDQIRHHQASGRSVFLDFTADWCLTCKANDSTTLRSDAVKAAFAEHDVVPMMADWTRRDDRITKALARLDRASVPLYVIVPANPSRPVILLRTALTPAYVAGALATSLP